MGEEWAFLQPLGRRLTGARKWGYRIDRGVDVGDEGQ